MDKLKTLAWSSLMDPVLEHQGDPLLWSQCFTVRQMQFPVYGMYCTPG